MENKDECQHKLCLLDNKYIILKRLGEGATSIVYKIKDFTNGKEYAAKLFKKYDDFVENEININKIVTELNCPFFIKYISSSVGYLVKGETTSIQPYILFELCSKYNPVTLINCNEKGLDDKMCKTLFSQILQIVKCLHKSGICHRDLKLDNFIFDGDNFNIKLGDFGFSSQIIKKKNGKTKKLTGKYGTKSYAAPEIILDLPYDGEKADIFSLGVILFTLRTCKFGFAEAKVVNFERNILKKLYNFIKRKEIKLYWELLEKYLNITGLSEEFKQLYINMVAFNPDERPTIEEIYNHEYMKEIRDLNEEEIEAYKKELIDELKKREEIINKSTTPNKTVNSI